MVMPHHPPSLPTVIGTLLSWPWVMVTLGTAQLLAPPARSLA
jgi:hypothetical protein